MPAVLELSAAPIVPSVNTSVELPAAGSTFVPLKESPKIVTFGGTLIGKVSSNVPPETLIVSPPVTVSTVKVMLAVEAPTFAFAIVAVFPSAQPCPFLIIVMIGADEPSVITSTTVPVLEPPVTATFLNVPGVPPVPPAIEVI